MHLSVTRLRRHAAANAISYVACFVALGGSASAAVVITNNSQVAPGVIAGSKAPSGTTDNIIANSIGPDDLADGAAGAPEVGPNAADTWRILDGSVASDDLAPSGVTSAN